MTLRPCVPGAQQGMSLPQVTARGLIPHLQLSKLLRGAWESPGGSLPTRSEPRVHTGVKPSLGNGGHRGVWGLGRRTSGLHWLGPGSGWKTLAQSCRKAAFLPRVRGSARFTTIPGASWSLHQNTPGMSPLLHMEASKTQGTCSPLTLAPTEGFCAPSSPVPSSPLRQPQLHRNTRPCAALIAGLPARCIV